MKVLVFEVRQIEDDDLVLTTTHNSIDKIDDEARYLLIVSPRGCGKTSLLANLVESLKEVILNNKLLSSRLIIIQLNLG